MSEIGIGIRVDSSQVVNARKELAGLAGDRKKYGIDLEIPVEVSSRIERERGGGSHDKTGTNAAAIDKIAKSAGLYRREMDNARKTISETTKDYDKLIKSAIAFRVAAGGGTGNRASENYISPSVAEMEKNHAVAKREAAEFSEFQGQRKRQSWAERNGIAQGPGTPGMPDDGAGGGGGDRLGTLGGALISRLGPYALAAYGASKMRQMWTESGDATQRINESQIPLDRLGEKVSLQALMVLNKRLLIDPMASLGMFNTLAHSGTARGASLVTAGAAVAGRAAVTTMQPEEAAQKQSAIGQHMQNLSYSAGQSQSDILARSIERSNTKNLSPRVFDSLVRLLSGVGSIRGRSDMTDGQGNRMANMMGAFWEYGSSKNSPFFMGGGIENLYTKAAGSIARGGGDPNSKMFMARALGAEKSVTNMESMWSFKGNMEDAANPKNQIAMAREAMKTAKELGLKGTEGQAFAKMQLQEAYGGNMTTREIDILMSSDYNNMLGKANTKGGRPVSPPSPGRLADSQGMLDKAIKGKKDIQMAEGLGQNAVGIKRAIIELVGDFAGAFEKNNKALQDNTEAIRKTPGAQAPGQTERFRTQK